MSRFAAARKKDARRVWSRSNPTGYIRPQRKFHRAKMRLYRKLQKALKEQMAAGLANAGIGPGVSAADGPEVKELT